MDSLSTVSPPLWVHVCYGLIHKYEARGSVTIWTGGLVGDHDGGRTCWYVDTAWSGAVVADRLKYFLEGS